MVEVGKQNGHIGCSTRDYTIDALKLFLIFLVIIGHFIESNLQSKNACLLYTVIYAFHMPLFVLISGYFSKTKDCNKIRRQVLELCETFLIFSFPYFVYRALFIGRGIFDVFNLKGYPTWYLSSLVIWKFLFFLIHRYFYIKRSIIIVASFLVAIITFFIPFPNTDFLSYMRIFQFLPFFAVGYCMNEKDLEYIRKNKNCVFCLTILSIIVLTILFFIQSRQFQLVEFQRDTVYDLCRLNNWEMIIVLYSKLFSVIGALVLSFLCISIFKYYNKIAHYGSKTLFIFCLQSIVFRLVGIVHFPLLVNVVLSLAFLVFCCYISTLINVKYITNPVSSLLKNEFK